MPNNASRDKTSFTVGEIASQAQEAMQYSPYLTALTHRNAEFLERVYDEPIDGIIESITDYPVDSPEIFTSKEALMKHLRQLKARAALLIGLADVTQYWHLNQITEHLSTLADTALHYTLNFVLQHAHNGQTIQLPNPENPTEQCGIVLLGMGKLGANELNYSSDIDIMFFFTPGKLQYKGRHSEQQFYNKMVHDIVNILSERTQDGYVFRTDLRLRPDPSSMPPAISLDAAIYYYETYGQNWERAAMIKARPISGDWIAGAEFLKALVPYIWRKHLDFAAVEDIHSIKRQMDTIHGAKIDSLLGHDIKVGIGGIREIEFFVQIHQLIWGGRIPELRTRSTLDALLKLAAADIITIATSEVLENSYLYLRTLEHRLQMVDDQQTHSLPENDHAYTQIAAFMGRSQSAEFTEELLQHLHTVHTIFISAFSGSEKLGAEGKLVFTGVTHDKDTLSTLQSMGFQKTETLSELVMSWHHGNRRCTRTSKSRELLTQLMPHLLKSLSSTINPDAAFLKFDEFLTNLPASVQLFSLFKAHPPLLDLVASILGSVPLLSESLSRYPQLIETALQPGFYDVLPTSEELNNELSNILSLQQTMEEKLDLICRFKLEKEFQAGAHLLKQLSDIAYISPFVSDVAELVLSHTLETVWHDFASSYGYVPDSYLCILGLGKLGTRELTFGSDLDLVFVYDVPDFERLSDGEKSFPAGVYFNRLCQRLISALSGMQKYGRIYEIDTRLRPSGKQGLLAVSFSALQYYFQDTAWTFENMALTKARVVGKANNLTEKLDEWLTSHLTTQRDAVSLKQDVQHMRHRVTSEYRIDNAWDIKHTAGGMMEIDFIAEYLLLAYATHYPDLLAKRTPDILNVAAHNALLDVAHANPLIESYAFLHHVLHMLRLTGTEQFDEKEASQGLKHLLATTLGTHSFESLKTKLQTIENDVHAHYVQLIGIIETRGEVT